MKNPEPLYKDMIINAFYGTNILVHNNSEEMFSFIKSQNYHCPLYLLMSSGDFDGFNINSLAE
jgi:hypothetical protein